MELSMQCCWSGSPPVRNGFLNVAGECGRAKRDLLRGGTATGGSEKVHPGGGTRVASGVSVSSSPQSTSGH